MKKERGFSENLSPEIKNYLGEIFSVLRAHYSCLSSAGMNKGRSPIGTVNELSIDTIRLLVGDRFLYGQVETEINSDSDQYLFEKKQELEKRKPKTFINSFTSQQEKMLTSLGVVLEWGWEDANRKRSDQLSYVDSPVGWGIQIVRSMLNTLIDRNEVKTEYEKIRGNPDKITKYVRELQFKVKDSLPSRIQK